MEDEEGVSRIGGGYWEWREGLGDRASASRDGWSEGQRDAPMLSANKGVKGSNSQRESHGTQVLSLPQLKDTRLCLFGS